MGRRRMRLMTRLKVALVGLLVALVVVGTSMAATFKNGNLVAQRLAAWQNSLTMPGVVIVSRTKCSYDGRAVSCTGRLKFLGDGETMYTQIRLVKLTSQRARMTVTWQGNKGFFQVNSRVIRPQRLRLKEW